jgi:predicted nucleic acid-binding protein
VIVVDTSVWIDHFNAVDSRPSALLRELVEADAEIGIVDVCLTEILQGFRRDRDVDLVAGSLLAFPLLRLERIDDFVDAAQLFRTARRRGRTVRSTIDCLIAAVCIREGAPILHRDRDFDQLARCTALQVLAT